MQGTANRVLTVGQAYTQEQNLATIPQVQFPYNFYAMSKRELRSYSESLLMELVKLKGELDKQFEEKARLRESRIKDQEKLLKTSEDLLLSQRQVLEMCTKFNVKSPLTVTYRGVV
jgi:hypothetical protein